MVAVAAGVPGAAALDAAAATALEDVSAGHARAEDAAAAGFRVAAELVDGLVAAARPGGLLVILDDLHWADEASLRLLRLLCGEVRESRLLVLGTFRDQRAVPGRCCCLICCANPGERAAARAADRGRRGDLPGCGLGRRQRPDGRRR